MERVTSSSAEALLEHAGPAIAAGSVNVISVEAIRTRCQARWDRTRHQVEEFVERAFARLASPRDLIVALNDLEYLTIQPDATRGAALNVSANVLKQTLSFFLGAAEPCDLKLLQVTGFAEGEIKVEPVDPSRIGADPQGADYGPPGAVAAPIGAGDWQARGARFLLGGDGQRAFHLALSVEPIWNVGARAVASFLVRERVTIEEGRGRCATTVARLPASVAGDAAVKTIEHAATLLSEARGAGCVGLHAPVPLEALSYSSSRYRLFHALKAIDPAVRRRLLLEITNLPHGFPPGRLMELVSALRPYSRAILARAPDETARVAAWAGCGLGGVALDGAHLDPADRRAGARLQAFAASASGVAPGCIGYAFGSRSLLMLAWAAGFTHVGGATVDAGVRIPAAQRLDPIAFWEAPGAAA